MLATLCSKPEEMNSQMGKKMPSILPVWLRALALALCAVDLGGRPYFVYDAAFAGQSCGGMDVQMAREFFYAISYAAMMNLHLKVLYGENDHHKLEAMFKAFAKALDAATRKDARIDGVLSTKGTL